MYENEAEPLPATPIEEMPNMAERENQIGEVAEWSKALSQSAGIDWQLAVGRCGLTFSIMNKIEAEPLPATLIEELPILAE
jgi:hypothetical protein